MKKSPVALIILDGFGYREERTGNAVALANTPNFDRYLQLYPSTKLNAAGEAVGLPEGQMGNSEVGHLNIGAGRPVYQSLTRINLAVRDESFNDINVLQYAIATAKKNHKKLHVIGLLSDGGVHSHMNHMASIVKASADDEFNDVYVHAILDGRDTAPRSALGFVDLFEQELNKIGVGSIATVSGRYYAMDRDKNYDRTQKAYDAMTLGIGEKFNSSLDGIKHAYNQGISDEFIAPFVLNKKGLLGDDDVVIFANFRPDRARQLSIGLSNPSHAKTDARHTILDVSNGPKNLHFVSMMDYGDGIIGSVIFDPFNLHNTFGEVVAANGMKQLRMAETEKYAHVTFFFDGGIDQELPGATRILIDSPKVATYNLKPEMAAYEVTKTVISEIEKGIYDTIILNFANPDMVGHSGDLEATIKAVEVVDECLGEVVNVLLENNGTALITADHGNAELMTYNGGPHTAHTSNQVPFILTKTDATLKENGCLSDIAPTMLELLGINQPIEMTGSSLIT